MVRGRRMREIVPCSRNEECYSPNPKRRDQGKTQSIRQFFQAVDVDLDDTAPAVEELLEKSKNVKREDLKKMEMLIEDSCDLDDKEKEEFKEIITTPNAKNMKLLGDLFSPHRIELCQEDDEEKPRENKIIAQDVLPVKKSAAPKAKRKLNNQALNQVQVPKSDKSANNHKLTEYFPVRRSVRKTNKEVLEEKQRTLHETLRKGIEEGLKVQSFECKGRGVVTTKVFNRGDFVVEYAGDLIDVAESRRREVKYAQDQNTGCYMYYFKHKGQQYCIDATAETGRLGRLVNHSRNGNLITRTIDVDNKPRLVLVAKDAIGTGEEVTYDYGDRSKESLKHHPWLAY